MPVVAVVIDEVRRIDGGAVVFDVRVGVVFDTGAGFSAAFGVIVPVLVLGGGRKTDGLGAMLDE